MSEMIPVLKVQIGFDSNHYVLPIKEWKSLKDEIDTMEIGGELILTRLPDMTKEDFEKLPEFEGF